MSSWRDRSRQLQGVAATARGGRFPARFLAIADSRSYVRSLFLASLAQSGYAATLQRLASFDDLVAATSCTRPERLRAWLDVGVEVGELRYRDRRWSIRGRRARSIAAGDALLVAHYRSMLEYQAGPYAELTTLLQSKPGGGRDDLGPYASTIADVSLAAAPFVAPYLAEVVAAVQPRRALDVGCGTGVYTRVLLDADARLEVVGIDLAADVVADSQAALDRDGYGGRARLVSGDVRALAADPGERFDLVTLCNNIYYFPAGERVALYRDLRHLLTDTGALVVVTETRPGSIASTHLHFMLCCQTGEAGLPQPGEIEADVKEAGYEAVATRMLVPTEPFVGIWARARL